MFYKQHIFLGTLQTPSKCNNHQRNNDDHIDEKHKHLVSLHLNINHISKENFLFFPFHFHHLIQWNSLSFHYVFLKGYDPLYFMKGFFLQYDLHRGIFQQTRRLHSTQKLSSLLFHLLQIHMTYTHTQLPT